jgi:peptidoglycan/xylan/chitin deacetylase (PgdA/CDA1 family)
MLTRRKFFEKIIVSAAAVKLGDYFSAFPIAKAAEGLDIPVLLYHRVGDTGGSLTITPDKFAGDLIRLREMGYETISLETFKRYKTDPETPLPTKPIMISFDDGYLDNFLNAYQILRKYEMSAAFYIITSMVGAEDRLATGHIREMAANGMSIGSHTVSHRQLGEMGIEEATNEMSLSRLYLEGMLQKPVQFIAYPKGSYNESTGALASEAGYWGGFSIVPGTCSRSTDPYLLKRIPVFSFDGDIGRTMAKQRVRV